MAGRRLFTEVGTKIVAVGRNYAAHAQELGNALPKVLSLSHTQHIHMHLYHIHAYHMHIPIPEHDIILARHIPYRYFLNTYTSHTYMPSYVYPYILHTSITK